MSKVNEMEVVLYAREFIEANKHGFVNLRIFSKQKGVPKSSMHHYLTKWLKEVDRSLYDQYVEVTKRNKRQGEINGGKQKWKNARLRREHKE